MNGSCSTHGSCEMKINETDTVCVTSKTTTQKQKTGEPF
jgi:hypothetical protein